MPRIFRTRTLCFIFGSVLAMLGGFVGLRCLSCTKDPVWKTIPHWLGEHGIIFSPPPTTIWQSTFNKILYDRVGSRVLLDLHNSETQVRELFEFVTYSSLPNKHVAAEKLKQAITGIQTARVVSHDFQDQVDSHAEFIAAISNGALKIEWIDCLAGRPLDNISPNNTITLGRKSMELAALLSITQANVTIITLEAVKTLLDDVCSTVAQDDHVLKDNGCHQYQPELSMQFDGNQSYIDSPSEPDPLEVVKAYCTAACAHIDSAIDQLSTKSTDFENLRQDVVNMEFTGSLPFKLPVNYTKKRLDL